MTGKLSPSIVVFGRYDVKSFSVEIARLERLLRRFAPIVCI